MENNYIKNYLKSLKLRMGNVGNGFIEMQGMVVMVGMTEQLKSFVTL